MKLSAVQINVIRKKYNDIFINDLLSHIEENFPEVYSELGKLKTFEFIQYGIKKAGSFGFNSERSIFHFINLLLTLGPEFEKSKDLKWIKPVLYDFERDADERIEEIVELTGEYLKTKENAV